MAIADPSPGPAETEDPRPSPPRGEDGGNPDAPDTAPMPRVVVAPAGAGDHPGEDHHGGADDGPDTDPGTGDGPVTGDGPSTDVGPGTNVGLGTDAGVGTDAGPDTDVGPETGEGPEAGDHPETEDGADTGDHIEAEDRPDAGDHPVAEDRADAGDQPDAGDHPEAEDRADAGDSPDTGDLANADEGPEADPDRPDTGDHPDAGDLPEADHPDAGDLPEVGHGPDAGADHPVRLAGSGADRAGEPAAAPVGLAEREPRAPERPAISGHQGALDGIRAIAAFAVLVTHVAGQTAFSDHGSAAAWVTARGDVGVPIFFTLSGLLLFRPWVRSLLEERTWPRVRSYLWRRVLRILPAYWAVVLIALPALSPRHSSSPWTWAQHLLLLQVYDPRPWWPGTGAPGVGQMWSLATEMAFYLVLPLIAVMLAALACRGRASAERRARRLVAGLTALGMCSFGFTVLVYLPRPEYWLEETLPQSLVWFACGMVLSVVAVWAQVEANPDGPVNRLCRTVAASAGTCWLLAALVFAIACTPVAGPTGFGGSTVWDSETKTALYAIIGLVLVAPAALQPARETRMSRVLGNQVMRFLGKISYGAYLWQFLVIIGFFNVLHLKDGFHQLYSGPEVAGLLVVITVITMVVATASYFVIEAPTRRLYGLVPQSAPRHAAKHRKSRNPWSLPAP